MELFTGTVATILLIIALLYTFFRTKQFYNRTVHTIIGVLALMVAVAHSLPNGISMIGWSPGTVALILLMLSAISGVVLIFTRKTKVKLYLHIIVSILAAVVLVFHIAEQLLLNI